MLRGYFAAITLPDSPGKAFLTRLTTYSLFTARQTLLPTYPSPHRPQIRYVLSLLDNSLSQPHPKPESRASLFTQNLIIIDDVPEADLLAHLTPACDWIERCLANNDGNVLVHCHMGQSRSAAVVVAYLMRRENIGVERAIERVKRRRSVVRVNVGFWKQLGLWEGMGYDVWEEEVIGEGDEGIVAPDLTGGQGETVVVGQKVIRRRKEAYETWRGEQERRTKRFLENLGG